jgi:hypothetical protein
MPKVHDIGGRSGEGHGSSAGDVPGKIIKVEDNMCCCCVGAREGHGVGVLDSPVVIAQVEEALR